MFSKENSFNGMFQLEWSLLRKFKSNDKLKAKRIKNEQNENVPFNFSFSSITCKPK